ncbi:hypothetical protein [Pelagibius sp.]|uniref:hypothetical protein n=1 Tax=Pelagibius sp. TaxID=1931238 RepID=UPI00261818DC|nr:hypothetical protein [Pelagibius sp.]
MNQSAAKDLPLEGLPIWQIVKASYRDTFRHSRAFATAAALPFLISVILAALTTGAIEDQDQVLVVRIIPDSILVALFEIAWLRFLLLDTDAARPSFLPRPGARILPYVGYALFLLLLSVPSYVTFLAFEQLADVRTPDWWVFLAATLLLYVVGIYFSLRFGFVYLWIAVDAPERLGASWRRTRGNGLRLLLILFIVAAPPFLLTLSSVPLLAVLSPESAARLDNNSATGLLLWTNIAVEELINYVLYGLSATAMVHAFRHLTGWISDRDRTILERFE